MHRRRALFGTTAAGLLALASIAGPALGSSHREAPLIAFDPSADITDLYAFVSPDAPDTVTIIANYNGFQEPSGGPNFYPFNPDVTYWIKVDNTGDGVEDLTWTFDFETAGRQPRVLPVQRLRPHRRGRRPTSPRPYSVAQNGVIDRRGPERAAAEHRPPHDARVPGAVPGWHPSTSARAARSSRARSTTPSSWTSARSSTSAACGPSTRRTSSRSTTDAARTTSRASTSTRSRSSCRSHRSPNDGQPVTAADAANAVIGVWAGASRMAPSVDGGAGELVQVSRLGNPLINEVIIPIGKKDAWNSHGPGRRRPVRRQLPEPRAGGDREHGLPEPAGRPHDRARRPRAHPRAGHPRREPDQRRGPHGHASAEHGHPAGRGGRPDGGRRR